MGGGNIRFPGRAVYSSLLYFPLRTKQCFRQSFAYYPDFEYREAPLKSPRGNRARRIPGIHRRVAAVTPVSRSCLIPASVRVELKGEGERHAFSLIHAAPAPAHSIFCLVVFHLAAVVCVCVASSLTDVYSF